MRYPIKFLRKHARAFLLFILIGVPVGIASVLSWAYWIEPNQLTETYFKYPIPEWNGTENRVRVALAGDFHVRHEDAPRLQRVVEAIRQRSPDIVLLVGDFAFASSDPHGNTLDLPLISKILSKLRDGGKTHVYACLGNHDYAYGDKKIRKMLEDAGITVLEPGSARLSFGDNFEVFLGGTSNRHISYVDPKFIPHPPADFYGAALFVVHSPDLVVDLPREAGYHLTLAGHTHGGQVCLPGRIPFVPHASRIGDQYAHGMFEEGGKDLFVTRGVGESRLRLRLFCPPEIVFIDLVPNEALPPSQQRKRAADPKKILLPPEAKKNRILSQRKQTDNVACADALRQNPSRT